MRSLFALLLTGLLTATLIGCGNPYQGAPPTEEEAKMMSDPDYMMKHPSYQKMYEQAKQDESRPKRQNDR